MSDPLSNGLLQPLMVWGQSKIALETWLPFDSRWLHLAIGGLLYLLVAWVARKPLSSWTPWLMVAAADMLNEAVDLGFVPGPERAAQVADNMIDFLVTMIVPTLILVGARWSRASNQAGREA